MSKRNPFIKISVTISRPILKRLKDLASDHGLSVDGMCGIMLLEYLDDIRLREQGFDGLLTALNPNRSRALD